MDSTPSPKVTAAKGHIKGCLNIMLATSRKLAVAAALRKVFTMNFAPIMRDSLQSPVA
jgi:hypothetical protein